MLHCNNNTTENIHLAPKGTRNASMFKSTVYLKLLLILEIYCKLLQQHHMYQTKRKTLILMISVNHASVANPNVHRTDYTFCQYCPFILLMWLEGKVVYCPWGITSHLLHASVVLHNVVLSPQPITYGCIKADYCYVVTWEVCNTLSHIFAVEIKAILFISPYLFIYF